MDPPGGLPCLSGNCLNKRSEQMAAILAVAAALQIAAAVGLAYVGGFSQMGSTLGRFQWQWLIPLVAAFALSVVGYYLACQGVYRVDGGPGLAPDRMRAAVIAGFGGFFAHGSAALDKYALEAGGARERDADVRVIALGGMEHGVLGLIGAGAAIAVLVAGYDAPGPDFTLPWAVIPVPGFLFAFWAAEHYRGRLDRRRKGWRRKLDLFLDAIALVNEMSAKTFSRRSAVLGMTLFWLAEMFAIWAGIAAFGFKMNGAQLIVGVGTGILHPPDRAACRRRSSHGVPASHHLVQRCAARRSPLAARRSPLPPPASSSTWW